MTEDSDSKADPVNRSRRFRFVAAVVLFCLSAATTFSWLAGTGYFEENITIIDMFIGGMVSFATAISLAYIAGSVTDYNGGLASTFGFGNSARQDRDDRDGRRYDGNQRGTGQHRSRNTREFDVGHAAVISRQPDLDGRANDDGGPKG